jgi:hypothetical protein
MPVSGTILLIMGFFSFFILFLGYITFIYYEPFLLRRYNEVNRSHKYF